MSPELAEKVMPGFGAKPVQTRDDLYEVIGYLFLDRLNKGLERNATTSGVPI